MKSSSFSNKRGRVFYGWWVVAAGSLVSGLSTLNTLGFTVFFIPLSKELGLSRAVTSLASSIPALESGLMGTLSGWAIDRLGARKMTTIGCLIGGLGLVLLGALVHNLWALLLVYTFVIGLGFNMGFFQSIMAVVNAWFLRRKTLAMGVVNAAWGGFGFILIPTLAFLTLHFGWRTASMISGALIAASAIPAWLLIRDTPESIGLTPDGESQNPAQASAYGRKKANMSFSTVDFTVGQAMRTPAFWMVAIAMNLRMIGYMAVLVHYVPILVWKGLSEQSAANLVGVWGLLIIPSGIIVGVLGDALEKKTLIAIGMFFGAVAFFFLGTVSNNAFLWVFIVLLAFFDNIGVVYSALMGEYFGRRNFATLRGIIISMGSVGLAISPVLAGWIWDRTGGYTLALVPFAGVLVVAGLLFAVMPRPKPPTASMTVGTASGEKA